jgi:hypothetical protein
VGYLEKVQRKRLYKHEKLGLQFSKAMKIVIAALLLSLVWTASALANPYLAKPGERPLSMRISTCAVTGGLVDLYTVLDYGLFESMAITSSAFLSEAAK